MENKMYILIFVALTIIFVTIFFLLIPELFSMKSLIFGIILGLIAGSIGVAVARYQMDEIWKQQGFSVGKTIEEKKVVDEYWKNQESNILRLSSSWAPIAIIIGLGLIPILYRKQLGLEHVDVVIFIGCFTFAIVLIVGIILVAYLSDSSIRKYKIESTKIESRS